MAYSSGLSSSARRRCRWCDNCTALLVAVRAAFSRGRALKDVPVDHLPRLVRDMKLKLKGSFTGDVSVNVGGVERLVTSAPGSESALNSFSISVTSSPGSAVATGFDRAQSGAMAAAEAAASTSASTSALSAPNPPEPVTPSELQPSAPSSSSTSRRRHGRHSPAKTATRAPSSGTLPSDSLANGDRPVAAAEAELFGNKDQYFVNQLTFMERLVNVSRQLKAAAVAQLADAHNRATAAAVARATGIFDVGGAACSRYRSVGSGVGTAHQQTSPVLSAPSSGGGDGGDRFQFDDVPAPPRQSSLSAVDPDSLSGELHAALGGFEELIAARGGVFLPLRRIQSKGRVTRLMTPLARPIPTATRVPYSVVLEVVNDAVLPTRSKYDDISLKTSAGHLVLERRKHSSDQTATPPTVGAAPAAADDVNGSPPRPADASRGSPRRSASKSTAADGGQEEGIKMFGPMTWEETERRVAQSSAAAMDSGWRLEHVIVKHGDAMMQEHLAMQLIEQFSDIFNHSSLNLHVTPFRILPVSVSAGFVEVTPDAVSIDALKRGVFSGFGGDPSLNLNEYFGVAPDESGAAPAPTHQRSPRTALSSRPDATEARHDPGHRPAVGAAATQSADEDSAGGVGASVPTSHDPPATSAARTPPRTPPRRPAATAAHSNTSRSLPSMFRRLFGGNEETFRAAHANFVSSCAGYSIVSYLLQIKDRHNANILLDRHGHIIHIDFGFVFNKTVYFEKAPFKLTSEFIDIMEMVGGPETDDNGGTGDPSQSSGFMQYCQLCVEGFLAVRRQYDRLLALVEMSKGFGNAYPCLEGRSVLDDMRARFRLDLNDRQCAEFVLNLIRDSKDNWRTAVFDSYQRILNKIE